MDPIANMALALFHLTEAVALLNQCPLGNGARASAKDVEVERSFLQCLLSNAVDRKRAQQLGQVASAALEGVPY